MLLTERVIFPCPLGFGLAHVGDCSSVALSKVKPHFDTED